jgi:hypothetical protein
VKFACSPKKGRKQAVAHNAPGNGCEAASGRGVKGMAAPPPDCRKFAIVLRATLALARFDWPGG